MPAGSAGRRLAAAATGLAVLLLAACATVPDSGSVQQVTRAQAAAAGQNYLLQPITVKPQPGWNPVQIVSGFLGATASFAGDYAAARQYLTRDTRWHPNGFAAVVIGPQPAITLNPCRCRPPQPPTEQNEGMATVQVKDDQLATVTSGGQYEASPEGDTYTWNFQLRKVGGQWRITGAVPSPPPLYEPDFHRAYLPRELYFVSADGKSLVPDPVFVPLQATAVDVAKQLVTALLDGPPGWLAGATSSALSGIPPPASVTMNAGTATVNLKMTAALARKISMRQIVSQLVWTLASPSFAQAAIVQSVRLEINRYAEPPAFWSGGHPEQAGTPLLSLPQVAAHQALYSVAGRDVLQRLATGSLPASRIPVRTGNGQTSLGLFAVSPGGHDVAWAAQSGRAVYFGPLSSGGKLTEWAPNADITSISWAPNGSLWVVASGEVWMLQPGHAPTLLGGTPSGRVISIQVAPDNVRAVMVVKSHGRARLVLGAIQYFPTGNSFGPAVSMGQTLSIGTDVSDPTQAAWYDPNDLIVLSELPSGPLIQEVPVNGGSPTPLITAQDTQSISSAGPANPLAAGLTGGRLALASSLNSTWKTSKNAGQYPSYPAG